ncbi:dihydropteroate synthase [Candidatus Peribacteria bacterium]|nr:dihydropteroate synthase [Candidatus Peribacteria bacterium]
MNTPRIVGILNTTPDSYFDGGKFNHIDDALRRVGGLLQEGADIIDIGGESTGPGSKDVSTDEELSRVIPVIKEMRNQKPEVRISIDTYKAEVAKEAVAAGAYMINDITAGRGDANMFAVMAETNATVVLMYAKDTSARTTVANTDYDDVIETVSAFLSSRVAEAEGAGVDRSRIIIDPGMGHFVSSKPEYSFEILRRLHELKDIAPIFVSPSRKSFLAGEENLPPSDRLPATIVASAVAARNGATYIRTHDVLAVRRGCAVMRNL